MSVITGIFYKNEHLINLNLINNMNECISHMVPTGSTVWNDVSVAFGHQMFWTTLVSLKENLNLFFENSSANITADAKINTRDGLCEKLNMEDAADIPNSYFILKAYEKGQDKCLEKEIVLLQYGINQIKDYSLLGEDGSFDS